MSDFKPISERVRLLKQEAIRNDPYAFKERKQWITNKILACNGDERSLDELRDLLDGCLGPSSQTSSTFA